MCWTTCIFLAIFSFVWNYIIRIEIYQNQANDISKVIEKFADENCQFAKWITAPLDGGDNQATIAANTATCKQMPLNAYWGGVQEYEGNHPGWYLFGTDDGKHDSSAFK